MNKLRELRIKSGLQRKYVADKLNINADYLNHIERGIGKLDEVRAKKMAKLYRCSHKEILSIWEEIKNEKTS